MKTHITGTTAISEVSTENHRVVSRDEWVAERKTLLAREKELTRLRDQIARERRALPWVRIDKTYVFDGPEGRRTLAELFDGRRQLLVQHFMLAPGWEQGCKSCSFMADHSDGMNVHLAHRDVTFVAISRAPLAEIERFRRRMGWQFKWVSSHGSDFNHDFGVSFTPEEVAKGELYYNYGRWPLAVGGMARRQRVLQGRRGRCLSHLLDLRARRGGDDGHVQYARPHAQGPRREGTWTTRWSGCVTTIATNRHHPRRLRRRSARAAKRTPEAAAPDPSHDEDHRDGRGGSHSMPSDGAITLCCRRDDMSEAYTGGCVRGTIGRESGNVAAGAVDLLSLAAAPTFAIMALLTGALDVGPPDMLCSATQHASPLNGMVVMYLLMSAFHSAPWLKLISSRRNGARRA